MRKEVNEVNSLCALAPLSSVCLRYFPYRLLAYGKVSSHIHVNKGHAALQFIGLFGRVFGLYPSPFDSLLRLLVFYHSHDFALSVTTKLYSSMNSFIHQSINK